MVRSTLSTLLTGPYLHSERETNPRTGVVAGLMTYMTMAYIVLVNLSTAILHRRYTGLRAGGVFVATSLADAASVVMGLVANFPVAAGLGLYALVAFKSSSAHAVYGRLRVVNGG